jgi:hypothetical protein
MAGFWVLNAKLPAYCKIHYAPEIVCNPALVNALPERLALNTLEISTAYVFAGPAMIYEL